MGHLATLWCCHWGMMETGSGTGDEDVEGEEEGSVEQVGSVLSLDESCLAFVFAVVVVS